MQYWFSAQLRQYRLQFIRAFSNFMVKTGKQGPNGTEELIRVPCRYGDSTRIAATIVAGNSENKAPAVPFISCIISSISMNSNRRQDPQMVEKLQVNERKYDAELGRYTGDIGNRYTVERAMPVPYDLTFQVDIWTNNLDIKEQLIEQILVLYNPAVDVQTSVNPLDWTVLSYIEMQDNITWSSRSIPVGTDNPIDVATLVFKIPIWINPPAKVKKQSIIQQIITSIVEGSKSSSSMEWDSYQLLARTINTPQEATIRTLSGPDGQLIIELCDETGISTTDQESLPTIITSLPNTNIIAGMSFLWNDHEINIISTPLEDVVENIRTAIIGSDLNCQIYNGNQLRFINTSGGDNRFSDIVPGSLAALGLASGNYVGGKLAWWRLLELYGTIRTYADFGSNASQLRLKTMEDIEQTNTDLVGYIDFDQFDQNRIIWTPDTESYPVQTQLSINAIVDPSVSGPGINLPAASIGQRYLITEDMAENSASWGSATSRADDIIMFDGNTWKTAWSPDGNNPHIEYVLNQKTNRIYKWNGSYWSSLIEQQYLQGYWRLAL